MELKGLKTKFLGQNQMFFSSIDSTQKKIKSLKQPIDGTLVIADNQVAGVGTHDRKWYTGNGKNIAMSFALFPNCSIQKMETITLQIAECMILALKKVTGITLEIKEPNDIFYQGKKVAGILTETVCKGEVVRKIYIGMGMNVNQEMFPGNLADIATSLRKIGHQEFSREEIVVEFLNEFEKVYQELLK